MPETPTCGDAVAALAQRGDDSLLERAFRLAGADDLGLDVGVPHVFEVAAQLTCAGHLEVMCSGRSEWTTLIDLRARVTATFKRRVSIDRPDGSARRQRASARSRPRGSWSRSSPWTFSRFHEEALGLILADERPGRGGRDDISVSIRSVRDRATTRSRREAASNTILVTRSTVRAASARVVGRVRQVHLADTRVAGFRSREGQQAVLVERVADQALAAAPIVHRQVAGRRCCPARP